MKSLQICFLFTLWMLFSAAHVSAQQQFNLPLLSNWDDDNIPGAWTGPYNSCWGYVANGREYAFLASTQATYFFDITNPTAPELIDFIKTKDTINLVVNKDYATYDHYLYAVSDQGDNSLQIFDLQYLPDSVVLAYDSNAISKRCHTIAVDNSRLYMCSNTRQDNFFAAMDVFSLSDPLNPILIGTLESPDFSAVHEVFVRNDTAYCSNGYEGMWIYNMHFPATPSLISIFDFYPDQGYNHSSWLTDDSKKIVFTDEDHGLGVKLFDISDIHDAQFKSLMRSNLLNVADSLTEYGSVAHIPYIVGDVLLISYYHDGVVAYNISDPANPVKIGWYDTYPQNTDYYSYNGCWGLYPFLPSGNIIASDITNGLFILDGKNLWNANPDNPTSSSLSLGVNPVQDEIELLFVSPQGADVKVQLFDITGKMVLNNTFHISSGHSSIRIPVAQLATGVYVARVQSGELNLTEKILKLNK